MEGSGLIETVGPGDHEPAGCANESARRPAAAGLRGADRARRRDRGAGPHSVPGLRGPAGHQRGVQRPVAAYGDLGRVDADGFVYLTGRKKELLIMAGGRIGALVLDDGCASTG